MARARGKEFEMAARPCWLGLSETLSQNGTRNEQDKYVYAFTTSRPLLILTSYGYLIL